MTPPSDRSSSPGRRKKIYKAAVTLLALGGLIWLLDHIGWSVIAEHLGYLGLYGVAALLILGFAESTLDAGSLRAATKEPIGLLRILSFSQAGALVNIFIPWEAGEVLKSRLLCDHMPAKSAIAGTVVWNYIFKLSKPAAALTAAVVGWLSAPAPYRSPALWIVLASLAAFLPYLGFRLALRFGPASLIIRLATKLRILGRREPGALLDSASEIDRTVRHFGRDTPASYFKVFVLQYAARLTSWLTYFVALTYLAPHSQLSFGFCGAIYAGLSVMTYLVLLLPTRIGTTEGTGWVLFAFLGLAPPLGLITQVVMRLKAIVCLAIPAAGILFDKK